MHIAILFMQHDKSHKGRHVILVAGIALVSTVVVLSLPVIAAVPTMGNCRLAYDWCCSLVFYRSTQYRMVFICRILYIETNAKLWKVYCDFFKTS